MSVNTWRRTPSPATLIFKRWRKAESFSPSTCSLWRLQKPFRNIRWQIWHIFSAANRSCVQTADAPASKHELRKWCLKGNQSLFTSVPSLIQLSVSTAVRAAGDAVGKLATPRSLFMSYSKEKGAVFHVLSVATTINLALWCPDAGLPAQLCLTQFICSTEAYHFFIINLTLKKQTSSHNKARFDHYSPWLLWSHHPKPEPIRMTRHLHSTHFSAFTTACPIN